MLLKIKSFLLQNSTAKQTFAKNTFWLFIGEISLRLLKMAVFIYVARVLGVESWGVFSYVIALTSVFYIISDVGVNSVLVREKSKTGNFKQYIATGFFVKVILALFASICFLIYGFLFDSAESIKTLLPVMACVIFLDSIREFGYTLNRAHEKNEIEALSKIITGGVLVVSGYLFVYSFRTPLSFAYAYFLSGIIGASAGYFFSRHDFAKSMLNFNKDLIRPLLKEAWPLGLVSIFGVVLTNLDTVLLGWFKTITTVGIYSAAQKPIQLLYFIPTTLGVALLPMFSRLASTDKTVLRQSINLSAKYVFILVLPIVIVCLLFGKQIILLLFGKAYIEAVLPFKIMSVALLFSAPGLVLSNALFVEGKQKITVYAIGVGVLVNLSLSFALIPHIGTVGAALAATIAQVASNIIIINSARKVFS